MWPTPFSSSVTSETVHMHYVNYATQNGRFPCQFSARVLLHNKVSEWILTGDMKIMDSCNTAASVAFPLR